MSINCAALFRLDVLRSLKEHVTDSPFRTDEVSSSCEVLVKQIKSDLRRIASDKIICAMTINGFGTDTEAYQAAMGIYMVDKNLFADVFDDVFKEVAHEDSFSQVVKTLKKLKDCGAIAYAYCSLFKYIGRLDECLWEFECAVKILLQHSELESNEIEKLNELLAGIRKKTEEHLKYAAAMSAIEDMSSW